MPSKNSIFSGLFINAGFFVLTVAASTRTVSQHRALRAALVDFIPYQLRSRLLANVCTDFAFEALDKQRVGFLTVLGHWEGRTALTNGCPSAGPIAMGSTNGLLRICMLLLLQSVLFVQSNCDTEQGSGAFPRDS